MQVHTIYLLTYANADPATMLRCVTANAFSCRSSGSALLTRSRAALPHVLRQEAMRPW